MNNTALFSNVTDKYRRLFQKLESVQKSCGQVCDTTITGTPGKVKLACKGGISNVRYVASWIYERTS
jgi:hypothetical protein